jgi:protein SFI1
MAAKYLEKWLQAHRTKIALKAIAYVFYLYFDYALLTFSDSRARYLRLPSAPIRPVNTTSRPNPTTAPFVSRNAFPRRTVRTEERSDVEDLEPGPSRRGPRLAGPRSVRSETSPPRRPQSRFSVPVTRDSSPARSAVGGRWGRDANPPALPLKPASSAGGREVGRGGLLEEFRQLQRRSKTPSEHSRAREPP